MINDLYLFFAMNFLNPGVTFTPINPGRVIPGARNAPFFATPANEPDGWGASNTIDWKREDTYSLKFITGYREFHTLSGQDNDGSPVVILQRFLDFTHEAAEPGNPLQRRGCSDNKVEYTLGEYLLRPGDGVRDARIGSVYSAGLAVPFDRPVFDFLQRDYDEQRASSRVWFAHGIWHGHGEDERRGRRTQNGSGQGLHVHALDRDGVGPYQPLSNPANSLERPRAGSAGGLAHGLPAECRLPVDRRAG